MKPVMFFPIRPLLAGLLASLGGIARAQTYLYDDAGRLTTATYPDGSGVRYTYDASGNLTTVAPVAAPLAPEAPTVAAIDPAAAELTWNSATGATGGYVVQRRSSESDVWTTLAQLPAGQTRYTDSGVPTGARLLYRVQSIGGSSRSAFTAGTLAPAALGAAFARLINLSTRARVGSDSEVLIAGFHVDGTEPRPVIIRAVGPALLAVDPNFPDPLGDPVIEIFDGGSRSLARNDNWSDGGAASTLTAAFSSVGAFPFPAASRDAAVRLTLPPGDYTAVISGTGGSTGTALAEVYEETSTGNSRLTNLSSRTSVRVGSEVMIAGFVVQGARPARVLIRAIGPGLAAFGVSGTLVNPQLTVHAGSTQLAANDNWGANPDAANLRSTAAAIGAFALLEGSADAALLLTLEPGNYSATVSGVNNTSGVALVEVYQVD